MRRLNMMALIGGLGLLFTSLTTADDGVALPNTLAGKQAKRLIQVFSIGQKDQLKQFIQGNFSTSFLEEIPLERHVEAVSRFVEQTEGVIPKEIISSTETELRLLVAARKGTAVFRMVIEVEAASPNKISALGFRTPNASDKVSSPKIPEGTINHEQIADWMKDYMDRLVQADAFSGTVLVAHGNQVIFAKAYGLASRAWNQPNQLDTKFNLGSMNKMFTSVAIAQLVEQGKVSLDDPIAKHLPDYPNKDAAQKVKVRHLLSHTSGLADYFNDKFMKASRDRFRKVDDYFPLFAEEPLQFEPGTRFRYSNAGFMVLGAIVQKASGMDYFDYIRENIYKLAGMTNSDAYELDTEVPNLAVGYTRNRNAKPGEPAFKNNIFLHVLKGGPAGGGYSTVEDLHRFANALRDGKLIRTETLEQWTRPGERNKGYGFGFGIERVSQHKVFGHNGGFPGISSGLNIYDNGYTLAVLSNIDGGALPVMDKANQLLLRAK